MSTKMDFISSILNSRARRKLEDKLEEIKVQSAEKTMIRGEV